MKRIYLTIVVSLIATTMLLAQAPQGFNYTAIVRNADGTAVKNKAVTLEVNLQNVDASKVYYTEKHKVTTNNNGVLSVVIGSGTTTDNFSAIPWEKGNIFVQLKVDGKPLTATKLQSVPYALYAQSGGGSTSNSDVLFAVKNKKGDTVFAVYPEGVRVYVDKNGKAQRGGFAVATRGYGKGNESTEVFSVTPDSTRIYIKDNGKTQRGGFAIATRRLSKGAEQEKEIFTIDPNHNVKVVVDDKGKNKTSRGGFAVATRGFSNKGEKEIGKTIFTTTVDSTRVYLNDQNKGKAQRGGFAVATRSLSKGEIKNNFNISTSKQAEVIDGENRILWYPQKNAFMAGRIVVKKAEDVGENSFASGYECKAMGDYSTAIGYKALAEGTNSFALGEGASASKSQSYAIGREAKASGQGSYAFGSGCPGGKIGEEKWHAAPAPKAQGNYSYAFGLGSISSGRASLAIGYYAKATNQFSMSFGSSLTSSGYRSTAIGTELESSGYRSTAIGTYAKAKGINSVVIGIGGRIMASTNLKPIILKSVADGYNCLAMGLSAKSSSFGSVAIGTFPIASGRFSVAIGGELDNGTNPITYRYAEAKGNSSVAIGTNVTAVGSNSIAIGNDIGVGRNANYSFGIGLCRKNKIDSIQQPNTMVIMGGKVGIGTVSPDKTFVVNGDARITGNIYYTQSGKKIYTKPDFVFDRNYTQNYTITEIEEFIEENSHLPWLTSAKEEEEEGVNMTRMSFETLEAVENQQLQIIQLKKENDKLKAQQEQQNKENQQLKNKTKQQDEKIKELEKQIEEIKRMLK